MRNKKLSSAAILIVTSGLAIVFTLMLLQFRELALVAFVLGLGLTMLIVEPFVGLINYLVFIYVRPQEFMGGFKGLPVMLVIGGATLGSTLLYEALHKRYPIKVPQDLVMLLIVLAFVASHMSNAYFFGVTDSLIEFSSRVVMYFLISILVVNMVRLRTLVYTLLILTLFQAVLGIFQYRSGIGIGGQELVEGRIQGIGTFADPNVLAMTFLAVLPFSFLRMFSTRSILLKGILLAAIATMVYALFLTDSRGGFLTFGMLATILFSKKFGYKAGIALGVLAFAALFIAGPTRMQQFSAREESAYGRVEAWAEAIRMIEFRPIFGVGAHRFTDYHFRESHNSFLQCAAELGIFGLYAWLLLIVVSARNMIFVRGSPEASPELKMYAESMLYALLLFMVSSMFISRAYHDLLYIMVGTCVGITNIFSRTAAHNYKLMERKDLVYTGVVALGGLIMFKVFLVAYW